MPAPDWYDPSMMYGGAPALPPGLLSGQAPGMPPIPAPPQLPGASPAAAQAAGAPLTDPQRAAAMQQLANGIRGMFPTPQTPFNPMQANPGGAPMAPGQMAQNQMNPMAMRPGMMPGAMGGNPMMNPGMGQMNPQMLQNLMNAPGAGLAGGQNLMGSLMGRIGAQRPPLTAGPMGGGMPYM